MPQGWPMAAATKARRGCARAYSPTYYGAYCRDPEGNKLCFVHGM